MPSAYAQHKAKWINCKLCQLAEKRQRVVIARGTFPCDVLFIGEAPGQSEDSVGVPFVGPAGDLMDRIIKQAIVGGETYALTNLVGCIPLEDYGQKTAQPPKDAILACKPRVIEFIDICKPKLIVLVGDLAKKHVDVGEYKSISITHPAAILRMDITQKGLATQRCIVAIQSELLPW